ncbi:signal recognition particle, SRP9/SRP14 subunit [Podospora conica]|nr:signal recognition particle, SRP9/SRP14 subunit [Schizothecium conicum]
MGLLSQDEFFTKLTTLFAARKGSDHGEIFLSQKRYAHDSEPNPIPPADLPPAPILIRASDGKSAGKKSEKAKISTLVSPDDIEAFYARYADVCKTGMAALKPRDRTKRRKGKGKGVKKAVGGGGAA